MAEGNERDTNQGRGERPKVDPKMVITEIDKIGFKFIPWTYTNEFQGFMDWMSAIRAEINRVDKLLPEVKVDGNRDDISKWGAMLLAMRAKITAWDDLMILIRSLQKKWEQVMKPNKAEEAKNGEKQN